MARNHPTRKMLGAQIATRVAGHDAGRTKRRVAACRPGLGQFGKGQDDCAVLDRRGSPPKRSATAWTSCGMVCSRRSIRRASFEGCTTN